jgi:hypothetical protein
LFQEDNEEDDKKEEEQLFDNFNSDLDLLKEQSNNVVVSTG